MNELIFLGFAILISLIPAIVGQRYGIVSWFSPLHIVSYFAIMGTLIKTIGMIILPGEAFMYQFIRNDASIMWGYTYVLLFTVGICIGYIFSIREKADAAAPVRFKASISQIRNPFLLFIFGSVAAMIVVWGLVQQQTSLAGTNIFSIETLQLMNQSRISRIEGVEGIGASNTAIRIFSNITTASLVATFLLYTLRRKNIYLLVFLAILMFIVFNVLIQGRRLELLNIALALLCAYFMIGGKIRFKLIMYGALGLICILGLFFFLSVLRFNRGDFAEADLDLFIIVRQITLSTYFYDFGMSAVIIDRAGDTPLLKGQTYYNWVFGFIPREFWPDKPALSLGPYVKREVLGLSGTLGGINPTGPGEAFLNFGWWGIFVGVALGILFRRLEALLFSPLGTFKGYSIIVYPVIGIPFVIGCIQSTFGGVMVSTITATVIVIVSLRASGWKNRRIIIRKRPSHIYRRIP